jgi:hypothetical protein
MNDFERRQEEKRQRLLHRADKKDNAATGSFQRAHDLVKDIPFGQPILVGHHSEARHRRSLDRSHNAMGKGVALSDEAKRLRGRAAAVGTGGINSDDPSALQQLSARLAKLEENQNAMKRINRQYRKGGWAAVEGLTETERETAKAAMQADWRSDPKPFESYRLTNNNANIRRIRLRIKELQSIAQFEDFSEEFEGYKTSACVADNRVRVEFDQRPNRDVTHFMRRSGFVFSRQAMAWQRKLNAAGLLALKRIGRQLQSMALN